MRTSVVWLPCCLYICGVGINLRVCICLVFLQISSYYEHPFAPLRGRHLLNPPEAFQSIKVFPFCKDNKHLKAITHLERGMVQWRITKGAGWKTTVPQYDVL